jgi:hypothetical protein
MSIEALVLIGSAQDGGGGVIRGGVHTGNTRAVRFVTEQMEEAALAVWEGRGRKRIRAVARRRRVPAIRP